ncbi:MAG: STAS domain-containing protein [Candidatus Krumholzibacteria bacterium]|nr:STAS domain-containing protein [Candidatus Krumholzibacteria bacterium]
MTFDISVGGDGTIRLAGRLDSNQVDMTRTVLEKVKTNVTVDFAELRYISSAGLGLLLGTQKRLIDTGHKIEIVNMTPHIRDIFTIAGFDFIFDIK